MARDDPIRGRRTKLKKAVITSTKSKSPRNQTVQYSKRIVKMDDLPSLGNPGIRTPFKILRERYCRLPPNVIETEHMQFNDPILKRLNLPKMRIIYWDPMIQFNLQLYCPFHELYRLKFTDKWVSSLHVYKRKMRVLYDLDGIINLDCRMYKCDKDGDPHTIVSSDEGILKAIREHKPDITIPFKLYVKNGVTTKLNNYIIHRYVQLNNFTSIRI